MADKVLSVTEIIFSLTSRKSIIFFVFYLIFEEIKTKNMQFDQYTILEIFYNKHILKQEFKALLDVLNETIITVEKKEVTYFNHSGKQILSQCVEKKEDVIPNSEMIESYEKLFNKNIPIKESSILLQKK